MLSSIGMFEMILIAGIALMVLGPEKFPQVAKVAIRTFRDFKKYMSEAQRDIANELNPMKDELNSIKKVDVEDYVEKLLGTDDSETDEDSNGDVAADSDSDNTDDWHPEDRNEKMPEVPETSEVDEDSAQEFVGDTVPYGDSGTETNGSAANSSTTNGASATLEPILPEIGADTDEIVGLEAIEAEQDEADPKNSTH